MNEGIDHNHIKGGWVQNDEVSGSEQTQSSSASWNNSGEHTAEFNRIYLLTEYSHFYCLDCKSISVQ
jgi:hypothetical protein